MIEIVLDIETIPNQNFIIPNIKNNNISKIIDRKLEHKKDDNRIKYCSLNWEFNQIICIGYKINNGESKIIIDDDESRLLHDFWDMIDETIYSKHSLCNDAKFITFNGKRFDIPIITLHSALLNQTSSIIPNRRYDTFKHYDVLEVLTNFYQNQNFLTLQEYCKVFGINNSDTDSGHQVYTLFQENNLDAIKKHCIEDVEATRKLYDRIKNYIK